MSWFLKGFPKGIKIAKIAALEYLKLAVFFTAQLRWAAFKKVVMNLDNVQIYIFSLFRRHKNIQFIYKEKFRDAIKLKLV